MSMTTKNISITEELAAHIETMVRSGRYANVSDYMRDLVRRDQERLTARQELQGLIRDGIESGEPVEMDDADWQGIRNKARSRMQSKA